jgi:nicotinic acid mononucleotide adenylyltransferase
MNTSGKNDKLSNFGKLKVVVEHKRKQPCMLSFSGSFNPIHTGHIKVLEMIKAFLEADGYEVLRGYIAPSSDNYVRGKLGLNAIDLDNRVTMVELSIQSYFERNNVPCWLQACPFGIMSSSKTAAEIRSKNNIPSYIKIFEVGGADYALRAKPWAVPKHCNKPFICIGRGKDTEKVKELSQKGINEDFILIESEIDIDVSSSLIRQIILEEEKSRSVKENRSTISESDKASPREPNESESQILVRRLLEKPVYHYILAHKLL